MPINSENIESYTPLQLAVHWAMESEKIHSNRTLFGDDHQWVMAMASTGDMAAMWASIAQASSEDYEPETTVGELKADIRNDVA